jgi:hypothetical protein
MIASLGKPYFLEDPGMGLKWHPCSAPQFLAADAALHLQREHKINFADVAKMEVSIPPQRYQRHYAAEAHGQIVAGKQRAHWITLALRAMDSLWGRPVGLTASSREGQPPGSARPVRSMSLSTNRLISDPTAPSASR